MLVRYNRYRWFKVWEINGTWYGIESKYIVNGAVSYKHCISGTSKDEVIDRIEAKCKYEELIDNGMDAKEAMGVALFGN